MLCKTVNTVIMKKAKTHFAFSNITYALKNQWQWARMRVVFYILRIPLAIILSIVSAYFPAMLISKLEQNANVNDILQALILYFGIWFVIIMIDKYRYCRVEAYRYFISNKYQLLLTEKLLRTDYANAEDTKNLQKYSLAMNDAIVSCAADDILPDIISLLINCSGVMTYGAILFTFSPIVFIVVLFSAVVTSLYGRYSIRYTESHRAIWNVYERKMGYIINTERDVGYAKDIRVFNMARWLDSLYHREMTSMVHENKKSQNVNLTGNIISAILILVQNAAAYAIMTVKLLDGEIRASNFTFMIAIITGFAGWFTSIISGWNVIAGRSVAIGHYREYLGIQDKMNHGKGCPLPDESHIPPSIEFKNISFKYQSGEEYIIKNLNLHINGGEKIAIVGANGAGKTTLIKLLCGMYFPEEGDVLINGTSSKDYNIDAYYSLFSTVFQDMYMLPVTIKEFMSTTDINSPDKDRILQSLDKAGLGELISSFPNGMDTHLMKGIYDDGVDLSGGEKQKLMIARALYKDAPIVVLDEPTSALDPIGEAKLYEHFSSLTQGKTAVYISHRLASTRFCDRIILIDSGKIIETGTHDELMALDGKYAEMFKIQSRYYQ